MKKGIQWIATALPVGYMAAIWMMSGLPHDAVLRLPDPQTEVFIKESLHLIEFALLYGLISLALLAHGRFTPVFSLAAAVFSCFYGLADEIHQAFVPYRSATLIDAIKDVTGVAAAFLAVKYMYFERRSPITKWLSRFSRPTE